ncbi:MAG: S8 family peptidase [Acidobacteriaceae bacterium]|nr:S8 family peptidase [Acidobacteriaceae bacterium]
MRRLALMLLLFPLILLPLTAFAEQNELSPDCHNKTGSIDVIVQYKVPPQQKHRDRMAAQGGQVTRSLDLIKAVVAHVPATRLKELANDPDVAYISPDRAVHSYLNNAAPAVNAPYAWGLGYDGSGMGVAVIDSGMQTPVDLNNASGKTRVVYSQSFVPTDTHIIDVYGHGVHIGGLIAGNGSSSKGLYKGIAPNANIVNLRVLDQHGQGTDSAVINAINAAIKLKSPYNIRVINLSLGRPVFESYKADPLCQAVEQAWKAGIVVVVAAGNDGRDNSAGTNGYGTITAPGNDPYVITVGAMKSMGTPTRADDLIASYSSKGPTLIDHIVKPDIVAPGNRAVSLAGKSATYFLQNYPQNSISGGYFVLSGTSMAAAVVSGAVADVLEARPKLTPDQVKALLMKTASKTFPPYSSVTDGGITYTDQYDVFTIGAGYLDLQEALASSDPLPAAPMTSPAVEFDSNCQCVHFVRDRSALWGNSAMWGASALWGTNVFLTSNSATWGSSALWGNSAMWGTSTNSAFSALWGNSALWGTGSTTSDASSAAINGEN